MKIVWRMLLPFIIYLILFFFMASKGSGEFLDLLHKITSPHHTTTPEEKVAFHTEKLIILIVSIPCAILWFVFFRIEIV